MTIFSTVSDWRSVGLRRPGGLAAPMCLEWNPPPRVVAALPRCRFLRARRLPGRRGGRPLPAPSTQPLRVRDWWRGPAPRVANSRRAESVRLVTMAAQEPAVQVAQVARVAQ